MMLNVNTCFLFFGFGPLFFGKASGFLQRNENRNTSGTVDLQGPETSVLLLSFSNVCVTWSQARF